MDEPTLVQAAELKLVQLSVANRLGLEVPESVVTNDASVAQQANEQGDVVAKALSSGPGPAPFVQVVHDDMLMTVSEGPVLLQRALRADADVRVVTVGSEAFAWRRARREGEPIDWRAADPDGIGFQLIEAENQLCAHALRLADNLHLGHSVQDWLDVKGSSIFLEVNPAGNWVFLEDAGRLVLPRLVAFLRGDG